jgi:hypothetical protein
MRENISKDAVVTYLKGGLPSWNDAVSTAEVKITELNKNMTMDGEY